jgi:hypothetical protein
MKTDYEIVIRMRQLEKNRPSIYGNSFFIVLVHYFTLILGIALLVMFAAHFIDKNTSEVIIEWLGGDRLAPTNTVDSDCLADVISHQEELMTNVLLQLYLAGGLILLFINRLTNMIGRRNAFLMDFVEILEEEKKA